ncbi:MAG TPA: sigma-70 family RNA polymerase sigma factor [Kineosporiaceae bacterium]|nr:sigma-70 family RNA polymerase sigma factor [Kineosporiaceae bacterium]
MTPPTDGDEHVTVLVNGCLAGDDDAWRRLVRRYSPLVWTVARSHRLSRDDCQDVYQLTWTRVVQHLPKLRSPERFADWLTTAARRESLKHLERCRRHVPVADSSVFERLRPNTGHTTDGPDARILRRVRDASVLQAFQQLPARDQRLLGLLVADPPPSYDEISRLLNMPRGSIGPFRARALGRLRAMIVEAVA